MEKPNATPCSNIAAYFPQPGQYEAYVLSYLTGQVTLPPGLRVYLEGLL